MTQTTVNSIKRIFEVLAVLALITVLSACSDGLDRRTIEVNIPDHSWEKASGEKLWYTLRWTAGLGIEALHMNKGQRSHTITVPVGETILIAAYPLGDMAPFGAAVTPADTGSKVTLTQADGVLVNELLAIDRSITRKINYGLLFKQMHEKTDDVRRIGKVSLLRDLQNGQLRNISIKTSNVFMVDALTLPNGLWTSEYLRDPGLCITSNQSPPIELPEGVYRYLNSDMGRILTLIIDSNGEHYSYLRQSLI